MHSLVNSTQYLIGFSVPLGWSAVIWKEEPPMVCGCPDLGTFCLKTLTVMRDKANCVSKVI